MRWLAVIALAGCAEIPVPTDRLPIEWKHSGRHGYYEKGGAVLDGWTCGERYQLAVSGDPGAESLMQSCSSYTSLYGLGMSTFVVAPIAGALIGDLAGNTGRGFTIGSITGIVGFALGSLAGIRGQHRLNAAVERYNQDRGR